MFCVDVKTIHCPAFHRVHAFHRACHKSAYFQMYTKVVDCVNNFYESNVHSGMVHHGTIVETSTQYLYTLSRRHLSLPHVLNRGRVFS